MAAEFRIMTILHADNGTEWSKYILKQFESDKLDLKLEMLDVTDLDYKSPAEIQTAVAESYIVLLLVTYDFLDYMEKNVTWFASMLKSRKRKITSIVAVRLEVTADELEKTAGEDYDADKQWENFEIDLSGSNVKEIISHILGISDKNAEVHARLPRALSAPDLCDRLSKEMVEMIPSRVYEAGEKVSLIFSKEKAEGSVSVQWKDRIIPVTTVNPYCVTFLAPEIEGRKINLQVLVNDEKLRHFKLRGRKTPEFTSVELMCQSYGLASKDELDKKLAEKFNSSLCADQHAMKVLNEDPKHTPSGRQDCKYPTLLHWAAANGLKELCSVLLTAPRATEACNILNCDGDDVSDLAEKNKYDDLSEYITEFTETQKIVDVCDLYVQLVGSPSTPDDGLYEDMSGGILGRPQIIQLPLKSSQSKPSTVKNSAPMKSPSAETKPFPSPKEFLEAKIIPVLPLGATGSRSQSELIEIQEEVKNGNFTITEAEMLFSAWKARYESGCAISFKDRQQSLQALRKQHKKAMEVVKAASGKKGKKVNKTELSESNFPLTISDPIGMRKKYGIGVLPLLTPGRENAASSVSTGSHDSGRFSGRVSGRDSTLSNTSTSSEESGMEEKSILRGSRAQSERNPSSDFRKSKRDMYLQLDLSDMSEMSPPPLPPRDRILKETGAKKPSPPVATKPSRPPMTAKPDMPASSKPLQASRCTKYVKQ